MAWPAWRAGTARPAGAEIFSVAQHSLWSRRSGRARSAPRPARWRRLAALLHDAPEYVIGDMISPFKAALGEVYREVEDRLARAILQRFSITPDPPSALARMTKQADRVSAFFEATLYAGFDKREAETLFGAPEIELRRVENWLAPMPPEQAQALFLEKFRTYEKGL